MSTTTKLTADRTSGIPRSWVHCCLVAAGVGAVIVAVGVAAWPSLNGMVVVEYVYLPRYEAIFGFRGGRVSLTDAEGTYSRYYIEEVTPGGVLEKAGARAGDIPVDHHHSIIAFYAALREASEGRPAEFSVVSKEGLSWEKRRVVKLSHDP